MRKHNIGRISIVVILLNIIFVAVYLADKNDAAFWNTTSETEVEEVIQTEMMISMDETVDGMYITMLENIISDQKYSKENLFAIRSYEWYLTDNIVNTENYLIAEKEVMIYAADDNFQTYVYEILNEITK